MITEKKIDLQPLRGELQIENETYYEGSVNIDYSYDDITGSIFDPERENFMDVMHSLAMSWRDFL